MQIALEIGHGWLLSYKNGVKRKYFARGASGADDCYEYEVCLRMGRYCKQILEKMGHDVDLIFVPATIFGRGELAAGYDIFVSLHLNAFDKQGQGTETFVRADAREADISLANILQRRITENLGLANRGVRKRNLSVLRGVPNSVKAACLVESFFIDSVLKRSRVLKMADSSAESIAEGINEFCKREDVRQCDL